MSRPGDEEPPRALSPTRAPPALVDLREGRRTGDPRGRARGWARAGLLFAGFGSLCLGQPIWTLFFLLAWAGLTTVRPGGPRYPLLARRAPSGPAEAALLELRPGRLVRRVSAKIFVVEPAPGDVRLEVWQALSDPRFDEAWFELEVGPQPRVRGHAERAGPLLDDTLVRAEAPELLVLKGRWLGWIGRPGDASVEDLVARAAGIRERLVAGALSSTDLLEDAMARPILAAVLMLADPARFERTAPARAVRPSWRWLARDGRVGREARLRAARLLAPTAEPAEVLDVLDDLGEASPDGDLAARAAFHLAASSPHLQIAAAVVLERVGHAASRAALERARPADRAARREVEAAFERAILGIEARHGVVGAGALTVVEDAAPGQVSLPDPEDEAR